MPENRDPISEYWYGCLFCTTGQEKETARNVETVWPDVKAHAVCVLKRRTTQGVKSLQSEILIPGYVFFRAPAGYTNFDPWPAGVWRMLRSLSGSWRLDGNNEQFARWLFDQAGEIGLSGAHEVGGRIQIHSGPLKDLEGHILRIDRRNRSAQVCLTVNGREIRVWLGFELLEDNLFPTQGKEKEDE